MISVLWLLLIIPIAALLGFVAAAALGSGKVYDLQTEIYRLENDAKKTTK